MSTLYSRDDGAGAFPGFAVGSINYGTGALQLKPEVTRPLPLASQTLDTASGRYVFTGWTTENRLFWMPNDGTLTVDYGHGSPAASVQEVFTLDACKIELTPNSAEAVIPGSLRLSVSGHTLVDRLGALYADIDPATGSGVLSGTIDYDGGIATLETWSAGVNAPAVASMATRLGRDAVDEITFRAPAAPVRSGSFQFMCSLAGGDTISVTADGSGVIADALCEGTIDYEMGLIHIRFGGLVTAAGNEGEPWYHPSLVVGGQIWRPRWAIADTCRFNCVVTSYLPLDADILGLDPVRLPSDGKVPIFRRGNVAVVHHTDTIEVASPAAGGTVDCGRTNLARAWVTDSTGAKVPVAKFSTDLPAGILTWATPLDTTGYPTPWTAHHRIEDMALVSDVEISGRLAFTRSISHSYPADESHVSSALLIGDMAAAWNNLFEQQTWTAAWSDELIGNPITPSYDTLNYPLTVTNEGAMQERWALILTAPTVYRCVGENVGQIAEGISTGVDFAPVNPATGQPYFTIYAAGFGTGWAAGNVIRFNTAGANYPVWVARTVLQSNPTVSSDSFTLQIRGDSDA